MKQEGGDWSGQRNGFPLSPGAMKVSFSLCHGPNGHTFRQDNLFIAFTLVWKSFLIGPPGGNQLSTADTCVTKEAQLPCLKTKRDEL